MNGRFGDATSMPIVHTLRPPLRLIEARYGAGRFNDDGDDILVWAKETAPDDKVCNVEFDVDATLGTPGAMS